MHIFVSICSYRDPLLHYTVKSLIQNSSGEHEITYSIFEQITFEDSLACRYPELANHPNVIYKRINPEYSDGCVWARCVNLLNIRDHHDFLYQIDSHMQFDPDWDRYLITDWEMACEDEGHNKVVISGSCKAFTFHPELGPCQVEYGGPITSYVKYYTIDPLSLLPGAHGDHVPVTERPARGFHILAGNFLAPKKWVDEVGLLVESYYDSEEPFMTLMSFEKGYRVYHHTEMRVYHLDETKHYPTKQWFKPLISMDRYSKLTNRCIEIWKEYLRTVDRKVLADFYEEYGIDFVNLNIDDRARTTTIRVPRDRMSDNDLEYYQRMGIPIDSEKEEDVKHEDTASVPMLIRSKKKTEKKKVAKIIGLDDINIEDIPEETKDAGTD